jgi:hypothetical protein
MTKGDEPTAPLLKRNEALAVQLVKIWGLDQQLDQLYTRTE